MIKQFSTKVVYPLSFFTFDFILNLLIFGQFLLIISPWLPT